MSRITGPWSWLHSGESVRVIDAKGRTIADVWTHNDTGGSVEDRATLLAAAPEMRDLLREMMEASVTNGTWVQTKRLLAKLEG